MASAFSAVPALPTATANLLLAVSSLGSAPLSSVQELAVRWMLIRRNGLLADEMGLGKTRTLLTYLCICNLQARIVNEQARDALIVVPASLITQWVAEAVRWGLPTLTRYKKGDPPSRFTIVSYNVFINSAILQNHLWSRVAFDEAHRLKNTRSITHQAATRLNCDHIFALTGTPFINKRADVAALFSIMHLRLPPGQLSTDGSGHILRRRIEGLPALLQNKVSIVSNAAERQLQGGFVAVLRGDDATEGLYAGLLTRRGWSMTTRSREKLTACVYAQLTVGLPMLGKRKFLSNYAGVCALEHEFEELGVTRDPVGEKKTKANFHASFDATAKIDALVHLIASGLLNGRKKLVFFRYLREAEIIKSRLDCIPGMDECGGVGILQGSTRPEVRDLLVDPVTSPFVLLIQISVGGCGLNLTQYSEGILFASSWSNSEREQAQARMWRRGQVRDVLMHSIVVKGSVDEYMSETCVRKSILMQDTF